MSIELKVKAKSLEAEAYIIRREENKAKANKEWLAARQRSDEAKKAHNTFMSLKQHRKWNVRNEQRATQLARAFIAGKEYRYVEKHGRKDDNFFKGYILPRIVSMVAKYHDPLVTRDKIYEWAK